MKRANRQTIYWIAILCLAHTSGLAQNLNPPTDTRLTDSYSPLGVDQPNPRFSWMLNSSVKNQWQEAYQLLVSSDQGISHKAYILWNSGKVMSSRQYGILYAGKSLESTTKYWWKVRVWDKDGKASAWSRPVGFVTGFLKTADWNAGAKWIRFPEAVSKAVNPLPMFRKEFEILKPVKYAWLYISGLGQFNAYLNGAKVGNHYLDPAWTDYDKSVNYVSFDVTDKLNFGGNVLGVMLGDGFFSYEGMRDFGPLKLIAQLHITYIDGTSTDIVSDTTWKAKKSPYISASLDASEIYDARLEVDGWNMPGMSEKNWTNVVEASPPKGELISQSAPPVIAYKTFSVVRITRPAPGVLVYDFGQNMNGVFKVKFNGPAGKVVKILPAEDTTANGGAIKERTQGVVYTLNGKKDEKWELGFSSIGFRYLEFQNVSDDPKDDELPRVSDVKATFICTASKEVGSFHASDRRYDQIYDLALNTLRSNLVSLHTDGPNYERLPWQEVTSTLLFSASYYFDLQNLFTKITRDDREAQRVSGLSPDIAPDYWATPTKPPGDAYDDAPAWGASMIMLPWQLYTIYGDLKVLRDNYDDMKKYLGYLKTKETVDGLVKYGLGDWMAPGGSSIPNIEGAIYVEDTKLLYKTAAALGVAADTAFYHSEFRRVEDAYNKAYYNTATKQYAPTSQADMALPVCFGIVPCGDERQAFNALIEDIASPKEADMPVSYGKAGEFGPVLPFHITTGDIGTTYLWRVLGEAGQPDLVKKMIMQATAPSYWNMIEQGCTTITENWDVARTRSHNHDMYAGIFEWFYRSLGGMYPLKPGYGEILLNPGFPTGLDSVSVSTKTVRGLVTSSWQNKDGRIKWDLSIPVNSKALVYVPWPTNGIGTIRAGGRVIWENGKIMTAVDGVSYESLETSPFSGAKYLVWVIGSGYYRLEW